MTQPPSPTIQPPADDGEATARQRPRWWFPSAAIGAAFAIAAVAAAAFTPAAMAAHADFRERAETVEAEIVAKECSFGGRTSSCWNDVAFDLGGEHHRFRRGGWNRPVGDRFSIRVDPSDPSNLEVASVGGGWGAALAFGALVLTLPATAAAAHAVGPRVSRRSPGRLYRRPERWCAVPATASAAAFGAAIAGGAAGWSDATTLAVGLAVAATAAAAMVWWQRRRADCLAVGDGRLQMWDSTGRSVRDIELSPAATVRPSRSPQRARNPSGGRRTVPAALTVAVEGSRARVAVASWGTDAGTSSDLVISACRRAGATVVPRS